MVLQSSKAWLQMMNMVISIAAMIYMLLKQYCGDKRMLVNKINFTHSVSLLYSPFHVLATPICMGYTIDNTHLEWIGKMLTTIGQSSVHSCDKYLYNICAYPQVVRSYSVSC